MYGYAILTVMLVSAACGVGTAGSSGTPEAPAVECVLTVSDSLIVYTRPDSTASVFSILSPGDTLTPSCISTSGWLGFDPGVAQAGNSGSFRYRWLAPGGDYELSGSPDGLDIVWGPAPGTTYAMTFFSTPVFAEPDTAAPVADSLPGDSAAGIVSRRDGWYLLNTGEGPSPETRSGWVNSMDVSVSGDLDSIPELPDPVLPD